MSRSAKQSTYHITTLIAAALSLLIIFTSAGYFFFLTGTGAPNDPAQLIAELEDNQALWDEVRPLAYRYVVERGCACPRESQAPYVATEQFGGQTAQFPVTVESDTGAFLEAPPDAEWIDDIFHAVRAAIDAEKPLRISYDGQYGFPRSAEIGDAGADAYRRYEVRDFEVLEHRQQ